MESVIEKSVLRAKRAAVTGRVASVASFIVALLITVLCWAYSAMPDEYVGELGEGVYGSVSIDMIDPVVWDLFQMAAIALIGVLSLMWFLTLLFWAAWFMPFARRWVAARMPAWAAALSALVPGFGVGFHYFALKEAAAQISKAMDSYDLEFKPEVVNRFYLWFWNAVIALFLVFGASWYFWPGVLFSELVLFVALFRYFGLTLAFAREERRLLYKISGIER